MEKEFDLLVFIGRFQPFHVEHKRIIDTALEKAKYVLVLVGSAGKARTIRNPFTFQERTQMIRDSYNLNQAGMDDGAYDRTIDLRLSIKPLFDKTYNDAAWINQVQSIVKEASLRAVNNNGFQASGLNDAKIGLIGMAKDHTSYYLKMFPQFDSVDVPLHNVMHATEVRERYLESGEIDNSLVPESVANFMERFKDLVEFQNLSAELKFVRNYKKQWEAAPYPVKHLTVDAVVVQSGHILLVKRKAEPGKGLWAIPGGHLNIDEPLMDGVIRELREETLLKIPDPVLRGNVVESRMFDDPHRSTIGRVVTYAAFIKLPDARELPKVKGADDAIKAKWVPISDLQEDAFFDDHYHIIQYFLGI